MTENKKSKKVFAVTTARLDMPTGTVIETITTLRPLRETKKFYANAASLALYAPVLGFKFVDENDELVTCTVMRLV